MLALVALFACTSDSAVDDTSTADTSTADTGDEVLEVCEQAQRFYAGCEGSSVDSRGISGTYRYDDQGRLVEYNSQGLGFVYSYGEHGISELRTSQDGVQTGVSTYVYEDGLLVEIQGDFGEYQELQTRAYDDQRRLVRTEWDYDHDGSVELVVERAYVEGGYIDTSSHGPVTEVTLHDSFPDRVVKQVVTIDDVVHTTTTTEWREDCQRDRVVGEHKDPRSDYTLYFEYDAASRVELEDGVSESPWSTSWTWSCE